MTWSPFLSDLTSGPTSTTTPAPSCPKIAGNSPSGSAPERVNSSVWQIPVARISTITSPALGPSSCTVSTLSGSPALCATAARTSMLASPVARWSLVALPTANQTACRLASPSHPHRRQLWQAMPASACTEALCLPGCGVQGAERGALATFLVEVVRRQPALHVGAHCRPLRIQQREPGGVAIAPLEDHMLA